MILSVPLENLPGVCPVKAYKTGGQHHENAGKPGRDEIHHIVQLRRKTAKIQVLVVLVAHHGVHGIDGFVEPAENSPADRHEKHRGDDAVGSIFRHGLYRRLGHAFFIQHRRVPAHDH